MTVDLLTRLLVKDLKTASELAVAGLIVTLEGAVLFGAIHWLVV